MKYHWSKSAGERRENRQSITFDEERFDPRGVSNNHTFSQEKISPSHLESEEELSARITDVLVIF